MKLLYSTTSPYVRKCLVTAIETGLEPRIERVLTNIYSPPPEFLATNPLGKIPALITDEAMVLYDSPVICEYLDSLHDGAKVFPASGAARWQALRQMALADGIIDAAVLCVLEGRRPKGEQSATWITRQRDKVTRGLDALEAEVSALSNDLTIGHIAIGCALGCVEFRLPDENWRIHRPLLADWYAAFAARKSMLETVPKEL